MSRTRLRILHAVCSIALFFLTQSRDVHDISLNFSGTLGLGDLSFLAGTLPDYGDTTPILIFGLILALILVAVAIFMRRARRRMAVLERALGPDGVLSVQEAELPVRTHKEIVESINWLEKVYTQIPTMDKESLVSLEHELRDSVALLTKAVNRDAFLKMPDDSLSNLKRALLIRARLVLETVVKEIASRS